MCRSRPSSDHAHRYLHRGLLVDEELADQAWDKGEINDQVACVTWWYISKSLTPDIDLGAYGKLFN